MKVSDALCRLYKRSTRRPQSIEFFKYKYYRDPLLKDKVSGKGEKESRAVCIEEMALMLSCLKSNDYDERPCSQLIDAFNHCVASAEAGRERRKLERKSGYFNAESDDPGEAKKLSSFHINRLLRKFPEP